MAASGVIIAYVYMKNKEQSGSARYNCEVREVCRERESQCAALGVREEYVIKVNCGLLIVVL